MILLGRGWSQPDHLSLCLQCSHFDKLERFYKIITETLVEPKLVENRQEIRKPDKKKFALLSNVISSFLSYILGLEIRLLVFKSDTLTILFYI